MDALLLLIGRVAGVTGVLVAGLAVGVRITNRYEMGGYEVGTLFDAGVGGMVLACLCFLAVLANRTRTER